MLIDLTHEFTDKMMVYPGDKAPSLIQTHTVGENGFCDFVINSGLHTGTHIDGPMHMTAGGKFLSEFDINRFYGKACVIDASGTEELDWDEKYKTVIEGKEVVLFYTGYSGYFGSEKYLTGYPVITERFALKLVEAEIKMIGVDTFSPDYPPFNIHKLLMGNNILIAENLTNLDKLFEFAEIEVFAFPVKFRADGAMARVAARVNE
jgi:kynurenine formamidase